MSNSKEVEVLDSQTKAVEKAMRQMLVNRNDDYQYARDVLYAASESLQDVLEAAVNLARESEHPRAIEVATNTAAELANIAGKMMDHHIKTKKLNNESEETKQVTNNNLNVKLNTKDLLELLGKE